MKKEKDADALKERILAALLRAGPMTGQELNRVVDNHFAHTYLHEIQKTGLVKKLARRRCQQTGNLSHEWCAVPASEAVAQKVPEDAVYLTKNEAIKAAGDLLWLLQMVHSQKVEVSPVLKKLRLWLKAGAPRRKE